MMDFIFKNCSRYQLESLRKKIDEILSNGSNSGNYELTISVDTSVVPSGVSPIEVV